MVGTVDHVDCVIDRNQGVLRRPNSFDNEWDIVFLSNSFDIPPTELGKKFPPRHYGPASIALRKTLGSKAIESSAIRLRRKVVSVSMPPTMQSQSSLFSFYGFSNDLVQGQKWRIASCNNSSFGVELSWG